MVRNTSTLRATRLSMDFDLDRLKSRLGEPGDDWVLLGILSPQRKLQIYSNEPGFNPTAGWTLLYFSPEFEKVAITEVAVES